MAKHIIFLVHGMGDFKDGWSQSASGDYSKSIQALIKAGYMSWPQVSWIDFEQNFEFCEINYNTKFEQLRKQWKDNTNELNAALKAVGVAGGVIKKFSDLAAAPTKNSFQNTHILDVVLYRLVRQMTGTVRSSVITRILDRLEQQYQEQGRYSWSIIAHSLGTAVVHDSLHAMYATERKKDGEKLSRLKSITYPRSVTMLANVSRVLESDYKVYDSMVAPGASTNANSICDLYLNVRHEWDPIPAVRKFDPPDQWPTPQVRAKDKYRNVILRSIAAVPADAEKPDARVVHDFEHYLSSPKCHGALACALSGDFNHIAEADILARHQSYAAKINTAWQNKVIDKLVKKKLQEGENDIARVLGAWIDFKGRIIS